MKETKHSGGEWVAESDSIKTAINSGDKHIAMVNWFNIGPESPRNITSEEHYANANLIAAAPKMLEVLQWLDNEMDCRDDDFGGCLFTRGDFVRVREAIRLAVKGK